MNRVYYTLNASDISENEEVRGNIIQLAGLANIREIIVRDDVDNEFYDQTKNFYKHTQLVIDGLLDKGDITSTQRFGALKTYEIDEKY